MPRRLRVVMSANAEKREGRHDQATGGDGTPTVEPADANPDASAGQRPCHLLVDAFVFLQDDFDELGHDTPLFWGSRSHLCPLTGISEVAILKMHCADPQVRTLLLDGSTYFESFRAHLVSYVLNNFWCLGNDTNFTSPLSPSLLLPELFEQLITAQVTIFTAK